MSIRERPYLEEVESYLNAAYKDTSILKYDDNLISLFIFEENYLNTFFFFNRAYQFKLEEVEGFRYRAKDAWRAVTRIAVREARLKEIKQEIFNSQKLKVYIPNVVVFL